MQAVMESASNFLIIPMSFLSNSSKLLIISCSHKIAWWYVKRFKSYRFDKHIQTPTNRHYWKQYHLRCVGGNNSPFRWNTLEIMSHIMSDVSPSHRCNCISVALSQTYMLWDIGIGGVSVRSSVRLSVCPSHAELSQNRRIENYHALITAGSCGFDH